MPIHETFYTNRLRDVVGFWKHDDVAYQVDFVEKCVPLRRQDSILDLACGFGRHSLLLARRGYSVTGYDQSGDYIERAKKDAQQAGVHVVYERMDMRTLDVTERFDVVLSLSTSLAFYKDDVNKDLFCRVHRALRSGGTFLFDQGNIFPFVSLIMNGSLNKEERLPDGRTHHCAYTFDAEKCVVSRRSVIENEREKEETGWNLRYYTLPELRALAQEIGFVIVRVYGNYDFSHYHADSRRLIAIMNKPEHF